MAGRLQRTGAGRRHVDKQKADDRPILIGEKLFMGSMQAACNADVLAENGISHILSVISSGNVPPDSRFIIKTVHIDDVERADLLTVLPECLDFCLSAVTSGGGVLVHCMSGVSRSAAVAIAFKMWHEKVSYDTAFTALKTARPDVDPNAGFIEQLHQFEAMQFSLDGDTEAHAKYRSSAVLRRRSTVDINAAQTLNLAKDPTDSKVADLLSTVYRCKGCSRGLFSRRNVISHESPAAAAAAAAATATATAVAPAAPAAAPDVDTAVADAATAPLASGKSKKSKPATAASSTDDVATDGGDDDQKSGRKKKKPLRKRRSGGGIPSELRCTLAIFIEPMVWMQANELIGQEEGKINCPSCFARLGTWAWAGFDCECTKKVVPAFKITRSKVERQDVSKRE